jgi:hypothetical protein
MIRPKAACLLVLSALCVGPGALAADIPAGGRWTVAAEGANTAAGADGAAIQAAIQDAEAQGGGVVVIPPGRFVLKSSLLIRGRVWLEGAGPDLTYLDNQSNGNAVIVDGSQLFGALTRGAGIRGLSVVSGAASNLARDANPNVGIVVKQAGHQLLIEDVVVKNHATGISLADCWYAQLDRVTVWAAATAGIRVRGGGSNRITNTTISNQSTTGSEDSTSVGLLYETGGGLDVVNVHALEFGYGLLVRPGPNESALYASFTQLAADANRLGGCVLDGSADGARVYSMRFNNSWCSYNGWRQQQFQLGSPGLYVHGAGVDTVLFVGGALRENGGDGAWIESGANVILSNSEVTANSNQSESAFQGVRIGSGADGVQVLGSRIGRFATVQTGQTRCGVLVEAGADHVIISGNDLRNNLQPLCDQGSTTVMRRISNNIPVAQ